MALRLFAMLMLCVSLAYGDTTIEAGDPWPSGLVQGDTVWLSDNSGNFTSGYTLTASGAYGNPIIVRGVNDEDATFVTDIQGDPAFTANGQSHYRFENISFEHCYKVWEALGSPVHNIEFEDVFVYDMGNDPVFEYDADGSTHFYLLNSYVDRNDDSSYKSSIVEQGNGDGVSAWSSLDTVLLMGNTIKDGNHGVTNFFANCSVIVFWENTVPRYHGGTGGNINGEQILYHKHVQHHPGHPSTGDGALVQWLDAKNDTDKPFIVRFSTLWDDTVQTTSTEDALGLFSLEYTGYATDIRNIRWMYNTMDGSNDASYDKALMAMIVQGYAFEGAENDNNAFINSIFVNPSNDGDVYGMFWERNEKYSDNSWFNNQYRSLLLHNADDGADFWNMDNTSFSYPTYDLRTIAEMESGWPSLISGCRDTLPGFNDMANHDYTLDTTSSPKSWAYQNATHLTRAYGAGVNSTSLIVDDALWLFDGWGFPELPPDTISINGHIVAVVNVDYATNTVTLSASISWLDNDEVWAVVNGEIADDVGAYQIQMAEGEEPPVPGALRKSTIMQKL